MTSKKTSFFNHNLSYILYFIKLLLTLVFANNFYSILNMFKTKDQNNF